MAIWATLRPVTGLLLPWVAFHAYLAWAWRAWNLFNRLPAYGDALEVLWGIEWWHEAVFIQHVSPLFTHLIFHPIGWHTATLAHTPTFFMLAQPPRAVGGAAFAYNALTLLAHYIAFAGAFRLLQPYGHRFAVTTAALMFAFWYMRWLRSGGHLNILWLTALLPWLVWEAKRVRFSRGNFDVRKSLLICGLIWGAMINFSLYGLFLGALVFLAWGKNLVAAFAASIWHRLACW